MPLLNFIKPLQIILKKIILFFYKNALTISTLHQKLVKQAELELHPELMKKEPYLDKNIRNFFCVEIQSSLNPFKMLLLRPGYIEDKIFKNKTWEPELCSLMKFFMKNDGIFLDVGANIGFHSLFIASSFERANCIAFEPNHIIYEQLVTNIKINNNLTCISAYDIALSDYCGEIDFYLQKNNVYNRGLSSTVYNVDMQRENPEKVRVKTQTIDSFLDDSSKSKVSVIKIDTEGNEYQVICGATDTIKKANPVIFFEFFLDYHPEDPEGYFKKILEKLPNYKIFIVSEDAHQAFYEVNLSDLSNLKNGDFIGLPQQQMI